MERKYINLCQNDRRAWNDFEKIQLYSKDETSKEFIKALARWQKWNRLLNEYFTKINPSTQFLKS